MNQNLRLQFSTLVQQQKVAEAIQLLMDEAPQGTELLESLARRSSVEEQMALFANFQQLSTHYPTSKLIELFQEGLRTNSISLFKVMALQNLFPSTSLPEAAFNQMVLKSVFNNLPVDEIIGLSERHNSSLKKQILDYRQERTSAARSVPDGVDHILKSMENKNAKDI